MLVSVPGASINLHGPNRADIASQARPADIRESPGRQLPFSEAAGCLHAQKLQDIDQACIQRQSGSSMSQAAEDGWLVYFVT